MCNLTNEYDNLINFSFTFSRDMKKQSKQIVKRVDMCQGDKY